MTTDTATQLREDQRGKFYFKRAFTTTFAILTALSAFTAAWMLIWALTIGGIWGLGQSMEEGQSVQGDPTYSSEPCDPSCDPSGDTEC